MNPTSEPDDSAIRRMMAVGKNVATRSNGSEFLRWVRDRTDLAISAGDDNWAAVDVSDGRRVVARMFPKRGIAKVRDAGIGSRDYGKTST